MINFTPNAIAQVNKLQQKRQAQQQDKAPIYLRIYIIGGGCNGFSYGFELVSEYDADEDLLLELKDFTLVVDALSAPYLENASIDYEVSLQGARFRVNNPNAIATCSCGSSFTLKPE